MRLEDIIHEYRNTPTPHPGLAERLLVRYPEHFEALLEFFIQESAPERLRAREAHQQETRSQVRRTQGTL